MQFGLKALRLAALASAMGLAAPALAQDVSEAEIDALIDGSSTPEAALALARSQAADGDLMGAAATLERALLANAGPATAPVRLYYAAILCRLGDAQTARAELARVDGRAVTDAAWDETRAACGDVERPAAGRSGGLHGEISAGIAYDSDLAGSLLVQLDLPGALPRDDGLSFTGSARLSGRAPTGGAFVYGSAGVLTRNTISGPSADYQVGDLTLGFGRRGGGLELSLGGIVRHTRIDSDPFVTELGGEAQLAVLMGDGRLTLRGEVVQQNYNASTALFSRDGLHYDAGLGYQGGSGTTGFWLGAAYERKDADTARTGYSGVRGYAGLRETLSPSGTYASLAAIVRYVDYVDAPGFVPVSETRWFSRAALGVPLGRDGLALEAAGSYSWRVYNSASGFKDYENVGGELRLVWNFGN
ncbi:MAG: hypothetical protein V4574_00600 [Pseudomonadota bacterium]